MSDDEFDGPNLEMPSDEVPASERKPLEVIQGGRAAAPARPAPGAPARAGSPAAPPAPPPTGHETIIIRMTADERALYPILVKFAQHLLHGVGMRPANPRAAILDLQKRVLSFQIGIPYEVLVPELVALEVVDKQPTTPAERLVRIKGPAGAQAATSSFLLGTNGRPLER